MSVSPTEHIIVTLGFHLTKNEAFDLKVIKRGLKVASACAMEATTSEEFRLLMEARATQIHNVPEEQLQLTLDG